MTLSCEGKRLLNSAMSTALGHNKRMVSSAAAQKVSRGSQSFKDQGCIFCLRSPAKWGGGGGCKNSVLKKSADNNYPEKA